MSSLLQKGTAALTMVLGLGATNALAGGASWNLETNNANAGSALVLQQADLGSNYTVGTDGTMHFSSIDAFEAYNAPSSGATGVVGPEGASGEYAYELVADSAEVQTLALPEQTFFDAPSNVLVATPATLETDIVTAAAPAQQVISNEEVIRATRNTFSLVGQKIDSLIETQKDLKETQEDFEARLLALEEYKASCNVCQVPGAILPPLPVQTQPVAIPAPVVDDQSWLGPIQVITAPPVQEVTPPPVQVVTPPPPPPAFETVTQADICYGNVEIGDEFEGARYGQTTIDGCGCPVKSDATLGDIGASFFQMLSGKNLNETRTVVELNGEGRISNIWQEECSPDQSKNESNGDSNNNRPEPSRESKRENAFGS